MPRKSKKQTIDVRLMPLFVIAVSLVFAFIYTVILYPLVQAIPTVNIQLIFVAMLVASVTVASVVAVVFYLILAKKL